jgi:5'(3')-deoxyribonucleotidase
MKQQTIAVDMDDVLAHSAVGWVEHSNALWDMNLTPEDYLENWGEMWGVEYEEFIRRRDQILSNEIVNSFTPNEQAKSVLLDLKQDYKLIITSARNFVIKEGTHQWLEKYFKDIFEEVHLAGFYDSGRKDAHLMTKAELLQSVGADFLIDDQPKHCLAAAETGVDAILFGDYAWNRNIGKLPDGVTRCKDWVEVGKYFDGIK